MSEEEEKKGLFGNSAFSNFRQSVGLLNKFREGAAATEKQLQGMNDNLIKLSENFNHNTLLIVDELKKIDGKVEELRSKLESKNSKNIFLEGGK